MKPERQVRELGRERRDGPEQPGLREHHVDDRERRLQPLPEPSGLAFRMSAAATMASGSGRGSGRLR